MNGTSFSYTFPVRSLAVTFTRRARMMVRLKGVPSLLLKVFSVKSRFLPTSRNGSAVRNGGKAPPRDNFHVPPDQRRARAVLDGDIGLRDRDGHGCGNAFASGASSAGGLGVAAGAGGRRALTARWPQAGAYRKEGPSPAWD